MSVERDTRRYSRRNAHKAMLVVWKQGTPVCTYFSMFRKSRCEHALLFETWLRAEV